MTILTKTQIISNFENGDVPTGTDFANWIETMVGQAETSAQTINGTLNVIDFNCSGATIQALSVNGLLVNAAVVVHQQVVGRNQVGQWATVSGTGSAQGGATTLSALSAVLTPTSASKAYVLAGGYSGNQQWLRNARAVSAKIYPPSGGQINGAGANVAYDLPGSARMMISAESSAAFSTYRMTE